MPDNIASSYANSIDPVGGISRPTVTRGGEPQPLSPKSDFNAALPITADQVAPKQGSEQVRNTNLSQNDGPKMTGPFGETIKAGTHKGRMEKDGANVIAQLHELNKDGVKKAVQGKAVVPAATLQKLQNLNKAEAMKYQFNQRVQAARAEERQAPYLKRGRSI